MKTVLLKFLRSILPRLKWVGAAACSEMHDAAKEGDLERVRALLKECPDLANSKDNYKFTPLHWAAIRGHLDVAKLLLANKADVHAKDNLLLEGCTALHYAASRGYIGVAELLLANKAYVDAKNNREGCTALHYAAGSGNRPLAELLLANKADVVAKDRDGKTPLHWAAMLGQKELAEFLLASLADARDFDFMTPLHWASVSGSLEVVAALLANKADVNAKNREGRTPLHWAAEGGYRDVVELLLTNKPDVNARDDRNETPLAVALKRQQRIEKGEWPTANWESGADSRLAWWKMTNHAIRSTNTSADPALSPTESAILQLPYDDRNADLRRYRQTIDLLRTHGATE